MSFGFIITRHVNSEKTNEYWNHSVKLIRSLYPFRKIVVIDDNSNQEFVKAEFDYKNVEIIQSEYPGRGELLPFVYYARNKWFDKAIIIHDSVFFHIDLVCLSNTACCGNRMGESFPDLISKRLESD